MASPARRPPSARAPVVPPLVAQEPPPIGLIAHRVTVLGASEVGKTSLISAFVNNFCPTVYIETNDAALYYKTLEISVRLPSQEQALGQVAILAELEDTYAWDREGMDGSGRAMSAQKFLTPAGYVSKAGREALPPQDGEMLVACLAPEVGKYRPVTHKRMAFLVVYDVMQESTYGQAIKILDTLDKQKSEWQGRGPIVALVACKTDRLFRDMEVRSPELQRLFDAKADADRRGIKFTEMVTSDLQRVRKLFRQVFVDLHERPDLWRREQAATQTGGLMSLLGGMLGGLTSTGSTPLTSARSDSARSQSASQAASAQMMPGVSMSPLETIGERLSTPTASPQQGDAKKEDCAVQ